MEVKPLNRKGLRNSRRLARWIFVSVSRVSVVPQAVSDQECTLNLRFGEPERGFAGSLAPGRTNMVDMYQCGPTNTESRIQKEMPPDDEARIRELPKLIAAEKDLGKLMMLAAELERLLTLRLNAKKTPPLIVNEKPTS